MKKIIIPTELKLGIETKKSPNPNTETKEESKISKLFKYAINKGKQNK